MFALSRVIITQEPGISDFCQCRFIAGVINVRDVPSPTYLLRSSASPLFNCSASLAGINCWRRTVTCSRVQAGSSPCPRHSILLPHIAVASPSHPSGRQPSPIPDCWCGASGLVSTTHSRHFSVHTCTRHFAISPRPDARQRRRRSI